MIFPVYIVDFLLLILIFVDTNIGSLKHFAFSSSRELLHMFELTSVSKVFLILTKFLFVQFLPGKNCSFDADNFSLLITRSICLVLQMDALLALRIMYDLNVGI